MMISQDEVHDLTSDCAGDQLRKIAQRICGSEAAHRVKKISIESKSMERKLKNLESLEKRANRS